MTLATSAPAAARTNRSNLATPMTVSLASWFTERHRGEMVEQPLELAIARLHPVDELLRDDIVCRAGQAANQWRHVRVVLLNGGHPVLGASPFHCHANGRRPTSRPRVERADYAGRG
jgi:hypothetical protein